MLTAVRHERTAVTTMVSSLHEAMHQGLDKAEAVKIWRQLLAVETSFLTSSASQEIRDEGRAEGENARLANYLRHHLDRRSNPFSDADRDRITTCNDPGQQQ